MVERELLRAGHRKWILVGLSSVRELSIELRDRVPLKLKAIISNAKIVVFLVRCGKLRHSLW